jgi:SAM-dependent methyltransferase
VHWDSVHGRGPANRPPNGTIAMFKRTAKSLLGPSVLERMAAYSEYILWEIILPRYFRLPKEAKVVEVGSAPGDFLVKLSEQYGCIPYGIEYSPVGVELNRATFQKHGFDPDNVIHADFFDESLRRRYFQYFDAVVSKGFIEHFTDIEPLLDRHIDLLKPGGYLLVDVPNFRGVNYVLARLFDRGAIPRHNLDIMSRVAFANLFTRPDLHELCCGYYGTFSFYLFTADESKLAKSALKLCHRMQPLLNLTFRTLLGKRHVETALFSPFLQYIGRKVEPC